MSSSSSTPAISPTSTSSSHAPTALPTTSPRKSTGTSGATCTRAKSSRQVATRAMRATPSSKRFFFFFFFFVLFVVLNMLKGTRRCRRLWPPLYLQPRSAAPSRAQPRPQRLRSQDLLPRRSQGLHRLPFSFQVVKTDKANPTCLRAEQNEQKKKRQTKK